MLTAMRNLYVQESSDAYSSVLSEVFRDGVRKIELTAGHHTGTGLASALQTELRKSSVHANRNTYDCAYSSMTGKIEISLMNDQGLTHDVSLVTATGSVWKVYNGSTYVSDEALQRTGQLAYSYVASGFQETSWRGCVGANHASHTGALNRKLPGLRKAPTEQKLLSQLSGHMAASPAYQRPLE